MPTRFLLAKRVPTRKGRGRRGASSRPAGACARGRGGPGQRSRRSRFHRLHRCRGDTCGRVRRPSRGTAELNAPGKPVGAMESAPCPLRSGTPPPPRCLPHAGRLEAARPRAGGAGAFRPRCSRSTNAVHERTRGLSWPPRRWGQREGTARRDGAERRSKPLPRPGLSPRCQRPRGGGGAGSCGACRSARRSPLSPPARPALGHGRGAAVRGSQWRTAGLRRPGEGPGVPGTAGGGGGGGVASQVPLLEERALLQMSSGPRSRARRVSATYGGWI